MPQRIDTKADMYRLLRSGAFGNRLRTWTTMEFAALSGTPIQVTLRYAAKPGESGVTSQDLPNYSVHLMRFEAAATYCQWIGCYGCRPEGIIITEAPPDDYIAIQGEVAWIGGDIEFRYSTTPNTSLRHAMRSASTARGALALTLLREHLTKASFDGLMAILEAYPDAVIEVSAWQHEIGDTPGCNAVVWEVRNY